MTDWTNGQEHSGLGGVIYLRMGVRPGDKKAGRILVRAYVGSSKNPLNRRQRIVQQETKTQLSLLVFRCLGAKEHILKLGGFTFPFAEITDKMSTETGFREGGTRFQNTIYTLMQESQGGFPPFFGDFVSLRRKRTRCVTLCWGRLRRLGSISCVRTLFFTARRELPHWMVCLPCRCEARR